MKSSQIKKNKDNESQQFMNKLHQYFKPLKQIYNHESYDPYLLPQRAIYRAIIYKQIKYIRDSQFKFLQSFISKLSTKIQSIQQKKKIDIKKINAIHIAINQYIIDDKNISKTQLGKDVDEYLCQIIRIVCQKQDPNGIFSVIIGEKSCQYSQQDYKKLEKYFQLPLFLIDYDKIKKFPNSFEFNQPTTYILKKDNKYYILEQKYKINNISEFKIIKNDKLGAQKITQIFKSQKIISQSQINLKSQLFAPEVSCSSCQRKVAQYNCIKWNYMYYCQICLINPKVNSSNIPGNLIDKFLRQHQVSYKNYNIICPQCQGTTILKNYNPSNKPKNFQCQICIKVICIQHQCMVIKCYCYCTKCRQNTIYFQHLNLNVCQYCNQKKCLKCLTLSNKFCTCICSQCLSPFQDYHTCVRKCHMCLNTLFNLKNCRCGLPICYGCYYYSLRNFKENGPQCIIVDYI